MNKPYQDIKLLDFQKKIQTEEDCKKIYLNFVGPRALFVLVVAIASTILFLSANCINAVNAGIKPL